MGILIFFLLFETFVKRRLVSITSQWLLLNCQLMHPADRHVSTKANRSICWYEDRKQMNSTFSLLWNIPCVGCGKVKKNYCTASNISNKDRKDDSDRYLSNIMLCNKVDLPCITLLRTRKTTLAISYFRMDLQFSVNLLWKPTD